MNQAKIVLRVLRVRRHRVRETLAFEVMAENAKRTHLSS